MMALQQMALFGLVPVGIVHVGANIGHEFDAYSSSGAATVVYIEPIPTIYDTLRQKVEKETGHHAIRAVCAEVDDISVNFNISSNNGESSSFLELGRHKVFYPDIVYTEAVSLTTKTLDSIISENFFYSDFNLLVLDTQGTELRVLKGAQKVLENIDCIYCEVSEEALYVDACTLEEVVDFLRSFSFRMKWLQINPHTYGDAFFVKEGARDRRVTLAPPPNAENVALRKPARQSSLSVWSRPEDSAGAVSGAMLTGTFSFCTEREKGPWWEVDFEAVVKVVEIRIHNRLDTDEVQRRANTLRVMTSVDGSEWLRVHDQRGKNFGGADGRPLRIALFGHLVRYIRIELAGEDYLHLEQVEVFAETAQPVARTFNPAAQVSTGGRNIALGRDAKQSSLSAWSRGPDDACGAVNGIKNGAFGFHTDFQESPWWEVDLGADAVFDEIIVYNRIDHCSERAQSLRALVSQDGVQWQTIYDNDGKTFGGADGDPLRIACPRTGARWVRLQLRGLNALHLDEVEIYDYEAVT